MKDKLCKQIPWTTWASACNEPCSLSPVLLRVAVVVLFDLLLLFPGAWASCQSCHLWRGLLAVLPEVIWVCKTAGTETKPCSFCDGKATSPKEQNWWAVLSLAEMVLEFAAGREAGEGDVVDWSSSLIPSCFCWQPAVKGGKGISGSGHLGPSLAATSVGLSRLWRSWPLTGADKQEWIGDSPTQ